MNIVLEFFTFYFHSFTYVNTWTNNDANFDVSFPRVKNCLGDFFYTQVTGKKALEKI